MSAKPGSGDDFHADHDLAVAVASGAGAVATYESHHHHYYARSSRATEGRRNKHYNLPTLPERYQPRPSDIDAARTELLGSNLKVGIVSARQAIGLRGMGGVGKTVLAAALAHDPIVRNHFIDGIYWLTFGQKVSILAKAAELAKELTGEEASIDNVQQARGQLGQLTADKQVLVVLDDVWEPEAADPFNGLGTNCRLLLTTRDVRVLERAKAEKHELDVLDHAASRVFLATTVGVAEPDMPRIADDVIRECQGLPLAMAAAGALVRKGTLTWEDVVAALREAALDELDTSWLADPTQASLAVVLKVSVDALDDDTGACFLECSALREDTDVPEAVLLRMWGQRMSERRGKIAAQELVDRSLIQRDDLRRYRIHDLYMDFLRHAGAPLQDRHRAVIARYCPISPGGGAGGWAQLPNDGYCLEHLTWHLREAGEHDLLRSMLFDFSWIDHKLKSLGVDSLFGDYELLPPDPEVARVAAAIMLSAHIVKSEPRLLAGQLLGRLTETDGSATKRLLDQARAARGKLLPVRTGILTRPGALLRTIPIGAPVATVNVLQDGRRVISGSREGVVQLWDLETGYLFWHLDLSAPVTAVGLLSGNHQAIVGLEDGSLHVFEVDAGKAVNCFAGHRREVTSIVPLPCGSRALTSSADRTLRVWNIETGEELRRLEGYDGPVRTAALLPDGCTAVSASGHRALRIWDVEAGRRRASASVPGRGSVAAFAILDRGRVLLTGSTAGMLQLWDVATGTVLNEIPAHSAEITTVLGIRGGTQALSASLKDRSMRLWSLETGKELRRFDTIPRVGSHRSRSCPRGTELSPDRKIGRCRSGTWTFPPNNPWRDGTEGPCRASPPVSMHLSAFPAHRRTARSAFGI